MKKNKILTIISIIFSLAIILIFSIYLFIIPLIVSNGEIVDNVCSVLNKNLPVNIKINKPLLKTKMNLNIVFSANKILITKENANLLEINNLKAGLNLKGLFSKKLVINELGFDYIFADINKLTESFVTNKEENINQNNDWSLDLYDSILDFKNGIFLYSPNKDTDIKITANNLNIDNTKKNERYVHFGIKADIEKLKKKP